MSTDLPLGLTRDPENSVLVHRLRKLERYDFSEVTALCQAKYGWSAAKAKKLETDTKQFLALTFIDWGTPHLPTEPVDDYWHRMILQTRWYEVFCDDLFGFFLHHGISPFAPKTGEAVEDARRTRVLMQHWFAKQWRLAAECSGGGHGEVPEKPHKQILKLRPAPDTQPEALQTKQRRKRNS